MSSTTICPYRLLRRPWHDVLTRHEDHTRHRHHTRHHHHTSHDDYTSYEKTERTRLVECITESDQDLPAAVTLDKLPLEIFQCIADFLPLDSVACLILTRKKVASAIGHRTWLALRAEESRKKRLRFLYTMQRDLKEWVVCFQCEKLHPLKRKPLLCTERLSLGEDTCSEADGIVELLPNYILRWQHAHMIMRLNSQNPTDKKWLSALSHVVFRRDVPYAFCCARITNGHLLVKIEYRILLPDDQSVFPQVCAHGDYLGKRQTFKKMLDRMLFGSFTHEAGSPGACRTAVVRCRLCATESVISVVASAWSCNGRALYITAWRNFGPCQTPFDTRWRTHISPTCERSLPPNHSVHFTPGSIRKAFEELDNPKPEGDGIMSMSPLDSDVEYNRQLDECSRRDSAPSKDVKVTIRLT